MRDIRRACVGDAPSILLVHHRSVQTLCAPDYCPEQIRAWTANQDPEVVARSLVTEETWVVECLGQVRGFGARVANEVVALYVDPDCTGQGLGHLLLTTLERRVTHDGFGLVRLDSTITAQYFYQGQGYRVITQDVHFLTGGIPVPIVVMEKTLGRDGSDKFPVG